MATRHAKTTLVLGPGSTARLRESRKRQNLTLHQFALLNSVLDNVLV